MDLYLLGSISWWESQCIYHALAELGREGLVLCYPDSPYVCLGIHDDLNHEIDQSYCEEAGLPLFRRETGGGVVYLDQNQIFYQVVLRKDNPLLPLRRNHFYRKMLEPAIQVYHQLGMPVEWKAPADLVCQGAKCSGNGAGDIGKGAALVGNLLFDFDFDVMANVLKSPHPIYRDLLRQSMRNNMCTFLDYNPNIPSFKKVTDLLAEAFEPLFGRLDPVALDDELHQEAFRCKERLTDPDWLAAPGRCPSHRQVKIAEGLYLHYQHLSEGLAAVKLKRDGEVEEFFLLQQGQAIVQETLFR